MIKEICVALGGGGARGLAHVGVLRVLLRERFSIRAVAGTSMGGIVGAFFAAGLSPDEIQETMDAGSQRGLLRSRPEGEGLIGLASIEAWLQEHFEGRSFEDLALPFAVTATDLDTGEEVLLREGPIIPALLATIALPGIFPPQHLNGRRLVDGGVVDPVPVRLARSLYPAPVVAVALSPPPEQWATLRSPSPLETFPVLSVVSRLRPGQALRVFVRSMEIASRSFTEMRLKMDRPELVIRPDVAHIGLFEERSAAEIAARGEVAALEMLPRLEALFSPLGRLRRGVSGMLQR